MHQKRGTNSLSRSWPNQIGSGRPKRFVNPRPTGGIFHCANSFRPRWHLTRILRWTRKKERVVARRRTIGNSMAQRLSRGCGSIYSEFLCPADANVVDDRLRDRPLPPEVLVVPLAVNEIADKPAHRRTGDHIGWEMLARPDARERYS